MTKRIDLSDEKQPSNYKPYESQEGFVKVPLIRGFTEIKAIYDLITPLGGFICGGYARYCASPRIDPKQAGDVDIYVKQEKNFSPVGEALLKYLKIKHENTNAITFERTTEGLLAFAPTVQLIRTIKQGKMVAVGSMRTILKNFDFTVVRAGILNSCKVLVDADFLHDEAISILRLKNIHCPISSTLRCCKYAKKGYFLRPMETLKLFEDWDNRGKEYQEKIKHGLKEMGKDGEPSQEDIDELEKLLRID